MKDNTWNWYAT